MRFLHSKNTILQPIIYRFENDSVIRSLWMSGTLNELNVYYPPTLTQNKKRKMQSIINNELMQLPFQTSCELKKDHLFIHKLVDINLTYLEVVQGLKQQDPSFFSRLDHYIETMETEEVESKFITEMVGNSPLYAKYFCLNAMRQAGMQHTIEVPLKALQKNQFLSQAQFNQIILPAWLRMNIIRQQQAAATLAAKPPTSEFVPYAFRP